MAILNKIDYGVERIKIFFRKYPHLFLVTLLISLALSTLIGYEWMRHMEFNGIVEDVSYNPQMYPTVVIKGRSYNLAYSYHFPVKIETGDKLIKIKGEIKILLIKPNSKDTIDLTKTYPEEK